MQTVKFISRILYYASCLMSVVFFWMAFNSIISLSTGSWLKLSEDKKYFKVCFLFTQKTYLGGVYNMPYILFDFLLPMLLYGLFFLLLRNVFKQFYQRRIFTQKGVTHLTRFYNGNFIVPSIAVLLSTVFSEVDEAVWILIGFHFILGVFAFFLAAIFKQGLYLQNEQDLFI